MKLQVGIIGNSIKHSLSPIIQNLALKTHNINANYEIWDTPIPELKNRIDLLKQDNVLGANVTIPYKEQVIPWLDSFSDEVKIIGNLVHEMSQTLNRKGSLTQKNVQDLLRISGKDNKKQTENKIDDVIFYGRKGGIIARTKGQKKYVKMVRKNDIVFSIGPAGTG